MAELVSIKRNVDVSPGQAAPAVFHCSQGDVGSKIILGLLNNGTAYAIPSGVTVTIEGSESNGSIFTPISATASGSDITFNLTGEMTAVAGPAICQAVLKSGSNILGTANFTLEVESSPMGADAPPVFTDAGWTWMLNKLNTEFVPALGDNIIDAIDSKADQSDLTALSNTVAGHTGSIAALNNTVNNLNNSVTENRQNIALKLDKNQGTANAGKYLKVGADGNVENADLIDDTLLVEGKAADAKATGVAISKKLNKYFGQAEVGKYLKVGTSGYVDSADLDVTTDKTLSIADKAADAKAVGDELDDLKEDLNDIEAYVSIIKEYNFWSNTAKTLLLTILNNAVYSTSQNANINALENALNDKPAQTIYTIVNNLSNCSTSNNSTKIRSGLPYTATITAIGEYTISSIVVTMGGVDVTTDVMSDNTINISAVTGNIVITALATVMETLTPVIAAPPNITTFVYSVNTYAVNLVYQAGTIRGGIMHVRYDKNVARNWNAALFVLDENDTPLKYTSYKKPENTDVQGTWEPYYSIPGEGGSYPITIDSFDVQIPEGCKAFLFIRPGTSPVYDNIIVTDGKSFRTWAQNGGVVVTVEGSET